VATTYKPTPQSKVKVVDLINEIVFKTTRGVNLF
jgi:hypothetical protein